jgi:hypothetical protein
MLDGVIWKSLDLSVESQIDHSNSFNIITRKKKKHYLSKIDHSTSCFNITIKVILIRGLIMIVWILFLLALQILV